MSTIVGTNIEVTNIKYDSDTTSMIISNTGQITAQGEGTATTNLQQGLAKSWLNMNAGTSITDSFNTASLSDFGIGDHGATFTNNMNNTTHVQVGSTIKGPGAPAAGNVGLFTLGEGPSTTGYGPCTVANPTNATDRSMVFSAVFGDLA